MHPTWSHSFALGRRSWTESSSSAKISSTPRDHHPPIHNICKFLAAPSSRVLSQCGLRSTYAPQPCRLLLLAILRIDATAWAHARSHRSEQWSSEYDHDSGRP